MGWCATWQLFSYSNTLMLFGPNTEKGCCAIIYFKWWTKIGFFWCTNETYDAQTAWAVVLARSSKVVSGASSTPASKLIRSIKRVLGEISFHGFPGTSKRVDLSFKRARPTKHKVEPARRRFTCMRMRRAAKASLTFALASVKCSSISCRLQSLITSPSQLVVTETGNTCIFSDTSFGRLWIKPVSKHGFAACAQEAAQKNCSTTNDVQQKW